MAWLSVLSLSTLLTLAPIDRKELVTRHNVELTKFDDKRPIQVGNGKFAFGMDVTGLQTFVPFNTMSDWGWHTGAPPQGQSTEDFEGQVWDTHGRPVRYPMPDPERPELSTWLASSPHRINLGRVALRLTKKDGSLATVGDLNNILQTLDLWTGVVTSRFVFEGHGFKVTTSCHSKQDAMAVSIESPLIAKGQVAVAVSCPGNNPLYQADFVGDWQNPGVFEPVVSSSTHARFARRMDELRYWLDLKWSPGASIGHDKRELLVQPKPGARHMTLVCRFSKEQLIGGVPTYDHVLQDSRTAWPQFWKSGGAVDFSRTTDPRAKELERRVVLSQYLMAVNEAGTYPPQESGLVNNGWYGRFHMEMVWWHAAHWALWNRWSKVEEILKVYSRELSRSKTTAESQGYKGARWPKCIGPNGREWPHEIHALLIWQQPHPIFFAELDYRSHPTRQTLLKWKPIVEATADFMASYAFLDPATKCYILGPPMHVASENVDPRTAVNPTFELGYWRFGLRTAITWKKRLGELAHDGWKDVLDRLAPLPIQDDLYVLHEGVKDMWSKFNFEHPVLLGVLGMLPGDGVDRKILSRTFNKVMQTWDFNRVWGWDFPLLAMCAARLGRREEAINLLLHPSPQFQFDARGLATGGPYPYFPSNGGLLYAVAMMCSGWDGATGSTPGFPADWIVRSEGLSRAP